MATTSLVRKIGVRGGQVELEIRGEGPPLILLHGWALERRVWEPQVERLSGQFQTIAIDRRGFGNSSAPPNLALEVDDLVLIRKTLGLGPVALIAMSQAGRVALHFALAHPDAVWGLVLQGVPLDGFVPEERSEDAVPLASYAALVRTGELAKMKGLWRNHPLMRVPDGLGDATADKLLESYEGRDLLAGSAEPLQPIASRIGDIYAPSLVITGEHDTAWRQLVADALAYGIKDSKRAVIAGGYHLCNLTHPREFNGLVAEFLLRARERASVAAAGSAA